MLSRLVVAFLPRSWGFVPHMLAEAGAGATAPACAFNSGTAGWGAGRDLTAGSPRGPVRAPVCVHMCVCARLCVLTAWRLSEFTWRQHLNTKCSLQLFSLLDNSHRGHVPSSQPADDADQRTTDRLGLTTYIGARLVRTNLFTTLIKGSM